MIGMSVHIHESQTHEMVKIVYLRKLDPLKYFPLHSTIATAAELRRYVGSCAYYCILKYEGVVISGVHTLHILVRIMSWCSILFEEFSLV